MSIYIPKRILTRQPQGSFEIDYSSPYAKGLQRVIVPGCQLCPISSQSETYGSTVRLQIDPRYNGGIGANIPQGPLTPGQGGIRFSPWVNTTNEASCIIVQARDYGDTSNDSWFRLGVSTEGTHFPWGGSTAYADPFSNIRWISNALPSGKAFDVPHVIGISAKTNDYNAYFDGISWVSSNSGTFGLPSQFSLLCDDNFTAEYQDTFAGSLFLAVFWDRKLDNKELMDLTINPWQIFKRSAARISAPVNHAASGSLIGFGSSLSGSALRSGALVNHAASGSLIGFGSSLSGSALRSGASVLTPEDLTNIANAVWAHSSAIHCQLLLTEVWGRLGLDTANPLISGTTEISFGSIVMAMTEALGTVTVTRQ